MLSFFSSVRRHHYAEGRHNSAEDILSIHFQSLSLPHSISIVPGGLLVTGLQSAMIDPLMKEAHTVLKHGADSTDFVRDP